MRSLKPLFAFALLAASVSATAQSESFQPQLQDLQQAWAVANYQLTDDAQEQAFERLNQTAQTLVETYPEQAAAYIWQGIVLSTQAGVVGGLDALDLAEQSRDALLHALTLDASALDGSAYTSLGALYYKVPGWPLGFGDDDQAKAYLQQALEINPDGLDANFFYADFLIDQGDYKEALPYLQSALNAPARPHRELADEARKEEVRALLARVEKKLHRGRKS